MRIVRKLERFADRFLTWVLGSLALFILGIGLNLKLELNLAIVAMLLAFGAAWYEFRQYQRESRKAELDVYLCHKGKMVKEITAEGPAFAITPLIQNDGDCIAKFLNMHIFFPRDWKITPDVRVDLYHVDEKVVIEYNGGIYDVIHPHSRIGLGDWKVRTPACVGEFKVHFWVIAEPAEAKTGELTITIATTYVPEGEGHVNLSGKAAPSISTTMSGG